MYVAVISKSFFGTEEETLVPAIVSKRYEEPEPRLFSFNTPYGACPKCQGFGNTIDFDLDLVIPDKLKSLGDGAIEPWTNPSTARCSAT